MSKIAKFVAAAAFVVVGLLTGSPWLIKIGIALGISALTPSPKRPGAAQDVSKVSFDPADPRRIIIGTAWSAGQFVTGEGWIDGMGKKYLCVVFRLADHKCRGLNAAAWRGEAITIDPDDGSVAESVRGGNPHLWVRFYDGDWNQAADPDMLAHAARWNADCRGRGICYVAVTAKENHDDIPELTVDSLFQFIWQVHGMFTYDRRGSDQDFDDQDTWDWKANASVNIENVLRGIRVEDTSAPVGSRDMDVIFGGRFTDAQLPAADNIAAFNACDEEVDLLGGGTELRYIVSGCFNTASTPREVIDELNAAQAGRLVAGVGRWIIKPGVAQTPLDPIADTDLRIDGSYRYSDAQPRDSDKGPKNTVVGKFNDLGQLGKLVDVPMRVHLADRATDGGELTLSLQLAACPSITQAQRVMEIHRRRSRHGRNAQVTLPPEWLGLEPIDWIPWTSARWGWSTTFEVDQVQPKLDDAGFLQIVPTLSEVSADDYGWDPETDELDRYNPAPVG